MTETTQEITFVEPLLGFDDEHAYTLSAIDPHGVLYSLRSVQRPDLRFVLTPARTFFADYEPDVAAVVSGILDSDEIDLMLVLTIGAGLAEATANLRAPIAVATSTGRAVQVVLEDSSLPMRQPLLPPPADTAT